MAQRLKHLPAMGDTWVRSLGQEDPPEEKILGASEIAGAYVFISSKTTGPLRGYYPQFLGELAMHSCRVYLVVRRWGVI